MTAQPQYRIEKVTACAECEGRGRKQNPAWAAFYAAHPNYDGSMTYAEETQWFVDNNWEISAGFGLPYEELPCSNCEGEGRIVEYIDLRDALREISQENHEKFTTQQEQQIRRIAKNVFDDNDDDDEFTSYQRSQIRSIVRDEKKYAE
jgi:hypothetical protein